VIGSPTAAALPSQPNTENPGGIFSCPVTTNKNDCSRVEMDTGRTFIMLELSLRNTNSNKGALKEIETEA